jgi:hypothetical protein
LRPCYIDRLAQLLKAFILHGEGKSVAGFLSVIVPVVVLSEVVRKIF